MPRKNKAKPEIVQDIAKINNANRMREVVRHDIYPFLLELNNTIGHTKIFLQTAASAVESSFNERQKTVKIKDLQKRLNEVFSSKDEKTELDYSKFRKLFEVLKEETLYDFNTMVYSLPRTIESYFTQETDKNPIMELNIELILGK